MSPFSVDAVIVASLDRSGCSLDQNVCGHVKFLYESMLYTCMGHVVNDTVRSGFPSHLNDIL